MVSSRSYQNPNKDFISNVPDIVTDKILELLPIKTIAKMSALSKQWRRNWLSLRRLNFDSEFCSITMNENRNHNWQECTNIISSVLSHHDGPVNDFTLFIPKDMKRKHSNISQWVSFLSKNKVSQLNLTCMSFDHIPVSSYIFWCSELVKLQLGCVVLNQPPEGFNGFPKLKQLELKYVTFSQEDIFSRLVTKCRMLDCLVLEKFSGMENIVLDVTSLKILIINGYFESIAFKDVCNLKVVSLRLWETQGKPLTVETIRGIHFLASSCRLRRVRFGGHLCKIFAASGTKRHLSTTFKHLTALFLNDLDLGDSCVLQYVFDVVENIPYVTLLCFSVIPSENTTQHKINCNYEHKMNNLVKVIIEGITGSSAELKLIEHLLSISGGLGKLQYKCGQVDIESELKLTRTLLGFPRASTKARIVPFI